VGRNQSGTPPASPGKLDKAISEARQSQGMHFDARRDGLDAETLRLEVLRLELASLVKGRAEAEKFIDLKLFSGERPRLWIDLVSYVVMAPTPRHYQLMRDRQDSSEILFASDNRAEMVEVVTGYIANRILTRERQLPPDDSSGRKEEQKYSSAALILAWFSGFLLGVIGLFSFGVWFAGP